jgi:hypothetical protein
LLTMAAERPPTTAASGSSAYWLLAILKGK